MGWVARRRTIRAAKDYARRLAPWLQRSFGQSERYNAAQIRAAVKALKLDGDFIALGYAAFLAPAEFDALREAMTVQFAYDEARALVARFVPSRPTSSGGDAPENAYASGGFPGDHAPSQ